ncbi:MAG: GntR family transcriptional regulator, transcriptional repressor for pyruvate dehydrogenase complex [Solirubrobacteraceae bacterium]|jgi:DNA-binding FadR family transcriptional regulator|nr:GntR family transcriptional regulator, transcriptional repressor for pyruvate dehydrogenase complex [Solirubrobacteraceae bacterium]
MPPGFEPQPVRRTGAAAQIAEQIRGAIRSGRLAAGERLPAEHQLAEEFEVSRGTVREAMKILSAAQLVEANRGATGGTFIALPEPDAVAEALGETIELWFQAGNTSAAEVDQARLWIERGCMRVAAENRTEEDLDAIAEALEAGSDPSIDTDLFLAYDLEFHVAISRAAHNAVMELAMTAIHLARPRTNTLLIAVLERARAPVVAQHHVILDAIRSGDPDAAERAFVAHMDYMTGVQREALEHRDARDIPIGSLTETHPAIDILKSRRASQTPGRTGRSG